MEDVIRRAIEQFNVKEDLGFKLSRDLSKYMPRLAKKSGKPNYDLPGLELGNSLLKCKIDKVAVIFDEKNIVYNRIVRNDIVQPLLQESEVTKPKKKCCDICSLF